VNRERSDWILQLRRERNLGARRIQNELKRLYDLSLSLSLSTIQKALVIHEVIPLRRLPRKKRVLRYAKKMPGERVQIDTCQIAPGLYQYTAVDDCTCYQVLELYPKRTAQNTLDFPEKVIEEMPFPVQWVQTDHGREFFAYKVQEWLMDNCIKFRPNRPGVPHLNGKGERAQRTDLEEFYATVDLHNDRLRGLLEEWQHYYNGSRIHGTLGKPPIDQYFEQ
jgi:transposase InsO family protein